MRLDQQIDLDGGLHDVAPATAKLKLFEPAPNQLAGQQQMETTTQGKDTQ